MPFDYFYGALKTTVLAASHHGAATHGSNSPEWIENTAPEVVIYSAGPRLDSTHPRCDVVSRYTSLATVTAHDFQCGNDDGTFAAVQSTTRAEFNTEVSGAIVVTTEGTSPLRLQCVRGALETCDMQIEF